MQGTRTWRAALLVVLGGAWLAGCSLIVEGTLDDEGEPGDRDGGGVDGPVGDAGDGDADPRDGGSVPDGETPGDSGTDPDGGPDPDGGSTCSGTHACVSDVPAGWTGPVALFAEAVGTTVPACAGDYPTDTGSYFGDLDVGSLTCACECDAATGISCTGATGLCYGSGATFCISFCSSTFTGPAPGECRPVSTSGTHAQVHFPAPASHGSCAARAAHVRVDPQWGTVAKACGGATSSTEGCASGETCTPLPSGAFDELCIVQSGDVACPAGTYTNKQVFYEGFADDRTCSACSCGAAESECGGRVDFTDDTCGSILYGRVTGCGEHGNGPSAIYMPDPSGTCPPSPSTGSGTVTATGAITFCCRP